MGITLREATAESLKGSAVEVALNTLQKCLNTTNSPHSSVLVLRKCPRQEPTRFFHVFPGFYHQLPQKWEVILSIQTCPKIGYIIILTQFQPRLNNNNQSI
jgi:hypothetical protein